MWKAVNSIKNSYTSSHKDTNIINHRNFCITDEIQIANHFNAHFTEVGRTLAQKFTDANDDYHLPFRKPYF